MSRSWVCGHDSYPSPALFEAVRRGSGFKKIAEPSPSVNATERQSGFAFTKEKNVNT